MKKKTPTTVRQKLADANYLIESQQTDVAMLLARQKEDAQRIADLQALLCEENESVIKLMQENFALTTIAKELDVFYRGEIEKLKSAPKSNREHLPDTRDSINHKFDIGGVEGYIIVGLYPDRRPGELFVNIQKEGSTVGGLMDSIGILTSIALQYGVPLENLVKKFEHQRFEPSGLTTNPEIRMASSIVDYVFRFLKYLFPDGKLDSQRALKRTVE